jgi:thioredoxin 1
MVRETNEETFDQEIKQGVALVDFFATWCPPCKIMHPVVEEISKEYEGKAKVLKVDVDRNPELAMRYSIMSVPTFIIFKDGDISSSVIGAVAKSELTKRIDEALGKK